MASPELLMRANALVGQVSTRDLSPLCIEALRRTHKRMTTQGSPGHIQTSEFGRDVFGLIANQLGSTATTSAAALHGLESVFPFDTALDRYAALVGIAEFLDSFVRAGFATPLSGQPNAHAIWYRLTLSGQRFLDSTDDHPLLPGSVERLRDRCPGLPEGIVALLTDARTCMDHSLLRPAVVLMGLAFEEAVERIATALVENQNLPADVLDKAAAARLTRLRALVESLPTQTGPQKDRRSMLTSALDYADDLRRRRNDASHTTPRYGFEDRGEVEEFLVSASRKLPALWSMKDASWPS